MNHYVIQIFLTLTNSLLILRPKSFSGCATSLFSFTFPAEDELEQVMRAITLSVVMNNHVFDVGIKITVPYLGGL